MSLQRNEANNFFFDKWLLEAAENHEACKRGSSLVTCTETWNAGTPERRNTETGNTETRETKLLKPGTYERINN